MNIKSLIKQFNSSNNGHAKLLVIVQPNAIYFSQHSTLSLSSVAYENGRWMQALATSLNTQSIEGFAVSVVLNSSLYQTYQIETPNIPQEEWSVALPFLLKDLITEKVTEIVADAFSLPNGNKVQAYVANRSVIADLTQLLEKQNCVLDEVLTEDDVWGSTSPDLPSYLLLQRSVRGHYKISAFHQGRCVFQRTILNIVAPLTGSASSALQIDGMALELQRSIDYLSSQLKGIPLHTLLTCCDEDEQQTLADALDERLNVKVRPLSEEESSSGTLLALAATNIAAEHINLYPKHLHPKKQRFTLQNVVFSWVAIASALLLASGYYYHGSQSLEAELASYKQQVNSLSDQASILRKQLDSHTPSPEKVAAVARLKLEIQSHRDSLHAIGDYDQSQRQGYSGVMRSLAVLGRDDISLVSIQIENQQLNLNGLAKSAQSVPNWVNQFRQELNLVGRAFEKLEIGRNDQDIITFELRTVGDAKR